MRIGITTEMFSSLIGANDFMNSVIKGLMLRKENDFYLLVSTVPFTIKKDSFLEKLPIPKFYKSLLVRIKQRLITSKGEVDIIKINEYIDNVLDRNRADIKIISYSTRKELFEIIDVYKIDVVLPICLSSKKYPSVCYLYDCQHKYYPQYFSKLNILLRDYRFKKLCKNSKSIIVNSKNAKNDLMKFYGGRDDTIFNLPFSTLSHDTGSISKADIKKYKLPKKYFIVSNQFWKHKSLETIFEALRILKKENYFVVFTGTMCDTRFPKYIDELTNCVVDLEVENNIKFLGLIPKLEQLKIMKNAVAVIQPTLFEGGPGGMSVCEAVSMGVRVIASDIPINHELPLEKGYLELFEKKNAKDLSEKMKRFWNSRYEKKINNENYIKRFSDKLYEAIENANQD